MDFYRVLAATATCDGARFIVFPLESEEALQFLNLDGNRVISVKCSENVSERHRRAFDRRVTVRQVLTMLGINKDHRRRFAVFPFMYPGLQ